MIIKFLITVMFAVTGHDWASNHRWTRKLTCHNYCWINRSTAPLCSFLLEVPRTARSTQKLHHLLFLLLLLLSQRRPFHPGCCCCFKWSSGESSLLQMIIPMDRRLAHDDRGRPAFCKWSYGWTSFNNIDNTNKTYNIINQIYNKNQHYQQHKHHQTWGGLKKYGNF